MFKRNTSPPLSDSYAYLPYVASFLLLLHHTQKQSKSKSSASSTTAVQRADPAALKMAKAWELAYSPAKSLPMNAIMLYMSGSGVQIFSMMAVGMLITGPLKGIASMNTAFSRFSSPGQSLLLPKLLFVLCQLAGIAVGLYKCWSMGLLPTETSDWLAWRETRTVSQRICPPELGECDTRQSRIS